MERYQGGFIRIFKLQLNNSKKDLTIGKWL
jgi:hypothetical protein